jgi:dephospho-CoA kinase
VVAAFGEQVIGEDGEVNRKELGKIVFGKKVYIVSCMTVFIK